MKLDEALEELNEETVRSDILLHDIMSFAKMAGRNRPEAKALVGDWIAKDRKGMQILFNLLDQMDEELQDRLAGE
jgi:hypothetical protein